MPKFVEKLVSKLSKTGMDKSKAYAIATSQYKKKTSKTKKAKK